MATLDILERANIAKNAILRMLTHRTGIEEDKVSLFGFLCKTKAHLLEKALDLLPVRHILLAAVGMDESHGTFSSGPYFHDLRDVIDHSRTVADKMVIFLQETVPPVYIETLTPVKK